MQKKYKVCIIAKGDRNSRAERGLILFFCCNFSNLEGIYIPLTFPFFVSVAARHGSPIFCHSSIIKPLENEDPDLGQKNHMFD